MEINIAEIIDQAIERINNGQISIQKSDNKAEKVAEAVAVSETVKMSEKVKMIKVIGVKQLKHKRSKMLGKWLIWCKNR